MAKEPVAPQVIDDKIEYIESDIGKIQARTGMYISYTGTPGAIHLAKELINNGIDEAVNPHSSADTIIVHLDEKENILTVSDNGRGIPFDMMELVCTKLQSGSKMTRENVGNSAGENGVGLTAVNALSDKFEMISKREGKRTTLSFSRGEKLEEDVRKNDNGSTGTTFVYKPSEFFLGECPIDPEMLMEWLEKLVYMLPKDITIKFDVKRVGREANISKKYRNKNGMYDYVKKKLAKEPILDPIHLQDVTQVIEESRGKTFDRYVGIEFAFTFNSDAEDIVNDSFCNFINTVNHGEHMTAVLTTMTSYFVKETKATLSQKAAKTMDIIPKDVHQGLAISIYLATNMEPQFASQTKEKLVSTKFRKPLNMMTKDLIVAYFNRNPKDLKKITEFIKRNAKARLDATKARATVIKTAKSSIDQFKIKNFTPARNRGRKDYRELLIIEGDSAAGSANQARFNQFQATLGLRGVPLNSYTLNLPSVLKNNEFAQLVSILGCGVGDNFNLSKIMYQKIIIMADSDVDGFRIMSLLCAFFIKHMPEVVEAGLLYKAVAPLYQIKDAKRPFILNKQEFIQVYEARIGDSIRLSDPATSKQLTRKQLQDFLLVNREYFEVLDRVSNHYSTHRHVIEFVAYYFDKIPPAEFSKKLTEKFPELHIDKENVITGIYEGYQSLTVDRLFLKRLEDLRQLIDQQSDRLYLDVEERTGKNYADRGRMSIGRLMERCRAYQPEIVTRFKGVGELNPRQLGETTLDPNRRILIQLTMEDLEREMHKFYVLHGNSSAERKELMSDYKINREDLDN